MEVSPEFAVVTALTILAGFVALFIKQADAFGPAG